MNATMEAFSDEFVKIAARRQPTEEELIRHRQFDEAVGYPRTMNKELLKEFLKTTGIIVGGTALGTGIGELAAWKLKRLRPTSKIRQYAQRYVPMYGMALGTALSTLAKKEKKRRWDEAYERGFQRQLREARERDEASIVRKAKPPIVRKAKRIVRKAKLAPASQVRAA